MHTRCTDLIWHFGWFRRLVSLASFILALDSSYKGLALVDNSVLAVSDNLVELSKTRIVVSTVRVTSCMSKTVAVYVGKTADVVANL